MIAAARQLLLSHQKKICCGSIYLFAAAAKVERH